MSDRSVAARGFALPSAKAQAAEESAQAQRPRAAELAVPESLDAVPEPVGQAHQQQVVRHPRELQRPARLEVEPAADEYERDVVQRVRVPLPQLVRPHDYG